MQAKNRIMNAGVTFGAHKGTEAADIAFSIHTAVDSAFYDVLYPDKEWYNIVAEDQVMSDVNPGATSYAYITRDRQGAAAFIGNGPNFDIPMVGQSAGAVQVPIAYSAVGAEITNEDARQYQFGFNGNLAQDLGEAMRVACDNLVESSVIFGFAPLGLQPWINYPGITTVTAASNGATTPSTKWADKTAQQVARDINSALTTMWENSRTLMKPLHVFIPLAQYAYLSDLPVVIGTTGTAETALNWIKKNNIMYQITGRELEILPSRYLKGAGASGVDRMVIMDRRRENQCLPFPMPYLLSQPIPTPLAAQWYAEQKFGSFHVRQQASMMYVDGI